MEPALPFYDVMVDIETTGTDRSNSAIIQIAAAMFDPVSERIGPCFDMCLEMAPGRFWDEDTRNRWASKPDVLQRNASQQMDPRYVIEAFAAWVRQNTGALYSPRLWGKPISFEQPFLEGYFKQFGVDNPFHFRDCVDMQSFIRGLRRDHTAPAFDKEVPMIGDAHYALDDVFHQIAVVVAARRKFINGEEINARETGQSGGGQALDRPTETDGGGDAGGHGGVGPEGGSQA